MSKYGEGYTHCACDECFDIAIGKPGEALCPDCQAAGCTPEDGDECRAYLVRCENCGAREDAPEDCVGCEYNLERHLSTDG